MQEASPTNVLGDFNNREFSAEGVTTLFYRDGNTYKVRTDGPDGKLADYTLRYTFGIAPLQQYLVEFPQGRLQVLGLAWDSRSKAVGGQRWFKLYKGQNVDHKHRLHWTQASQNWNLMCAECHSTNLRKAYKAGQKRYLTQWSELDVSCEACHGPASNHLLWSDAKQRQNYDFTNTLGLSHLFNERQGVHWRLNKARQPRRSEPRVTDQEIAVCAACHARRTQLVEQVHPGRPFSDQYLPATLDEGLYHADGQVDDEVFVYGSFLQSRMYQEGVTCSDCHNPHSLSLKAEGNGLCLQCHGTDYNSPKHHFHGQDTAGSQCINCHMPATTFMQVDLRRDHSFRIPRPDLSQQLLTPNACNSCHSDRNPTWAAAALRRWYGNRVKQQHYGEVIFAARRGEGSTDSIAALLSDQNYPAIARATAAKLLSGQHSDNALRSLGGALKDRNALVRQSAVSALQSLPLSYRWLMLNPLLADPRRAVRISAGEALADVPLAQVPPSQRPLLEKAFREFEETQNYNADTPSAQIKLGNYFLAKGLDQAAENAYREALALNPDWTAAYLNLADLYRLRKDESAALAALKQGLKKQPGHADLHFSMGLAYVRQQRHQDALKHFYKAARARPQNSHYQYVYALTLDKLGQRAQAIRWLEASPSSLPITQLLSSWRDKQQGSGAARPP